jgi:hypothetical protein
MYVNGLETRFTSAAGMVTGTATTVHIRSRFPIFRNKSAQHEVVGGLILRFWIDRSRRPGKADPMGIAPCVTDRITGICVVTDSGMTPVAGDIITTAMR